MIKNLIRGNVVIFNARHMYVFDNTIILIWVKFINNVMFKLNDSIIENAEIPIFYHSLDSNRGHSVGVHP
jgi:hypothetical protein